MTTQTLEKQIHTEHERAELDDIGILYDTRRDGPIGYNDLVAVYADGTSKRFSKSEYNRAINSQVRKDVQGDGHVRESGNVRIQFTTGHRTISTRRIRVRPAVSAQFKPAGTRHIKIGKRFPNRASITAMPGLFD
jgi:hypothetical protein